MSEILCLGNDATKVHLECSSAKLLNLQNHIFSNRFEQKIRIVLQSLYESFNSIYKGLTSLSQVLNRLEDLNMPKDKATEANNLSVEVLSLAERMIRLLNKILKNVEEQNFKSINFNLPELNFQLLKCDSLYKEVNRLVRSIKSTNKKPVAKKSCPVKVVTSKTLMWKFGKCNEIKKSKHLKHLQKISFEEEKSMSFEVTTAMNDVKKSLAIIQSSCRTFTQNKLFNNNVLVNAIMIEREEYCYKILQMDDNISIYEYAKLDLISVNNQLDKITQISDSINLRESFLIRMYYAQRYDWNYEVIAPIEIMREPTNRKPIRENKDLYHLTVATNSPMLDLALQDTKRVMTSTPITIPLLQKSTPQVKPDYSNEMIKHRDNIPYSRYATPTVTDNRNIPKDSYKTRRINIYEKPHMVSSNYDSSDSVSTTKSTSYGSILTSYQEYFHNFMRNLNSFYN